MATKSLIATIKHYHAVEAFPEKNLMEYFTHKRVAGKPFKVILMSVGEMDTTKLVKVLKEADL